MHEAKVPQSFCSTKAHWVIARPTLSKMDGSVLVDFGMTDTDQEKMDEVLARMLKTPHKPHITKTREKAETSSRERSTKDGKQG